MGAGDRKRSFEKAFENRVESFGVVSTGSEYVFLMINKDKIIKSKVIPIHFSPINNNELEAKWFKVQVEKILKMLVHVIEIIAASIDNE
jgi:hypothetical protein